MKNNKINNFNLPTNWDSSDLAYEYAKISINNLYNGYELNDLKTVIDKYFLNSKNKVDLAKIDSLLLDDTRNYLILTNQFTKLSKLTDCKNNKNKTTIYLEIIVSAFLEARKKDNYVIEIQFHLTDWLIYAIWFLAKQQKALKLLNKILSCSFQYPGVNFDEQYEICCKIAQKTSYDNENSNKLYVLLKNIYQNFIFNLNCIDKWEKQSIKNKKEYGLLLKNKILEWTLIHYLLPLYISINGYSEKDKKFKVVAQKLYNYQIDNELIIEIINLLIDSGNLVAKFENNNIKDLYQTVKNECEKILSENFFSKKEMVNKNLFS